MTYFQKEATYERSPTLGYASHDQVVEFVEVQAQIPDGDQLFLTRDPQKTARFGARVFDRMMSECHIYQSDFKPDTEHAIKRTFGGDELLLGTTFEVGISHPEHGILINLDYLDKLVNVGWTGHQSNSVKGKVGSTIRQFIEERKKFINKAESIQSE
jgi:hypothetical protein